MDTKKLEKYGVLYSDYLISDNIGIHDYIKKEYHLESKFIAYGAVDMLSPVDTCLNNYGLTKDNYFLSIARLEPENNLEMMFDAYISSKSQIPYYLVGNHITPYGDFLKDKYRNKGIVFLGGIYNKTHLDNIRYYSKLYIHGHSVGGTNPALLEAMAAKTLILAHGNIFNRSVLGENAFYILSSDELSKLFTEDLELKKAEFITNNLNKIDKIYRWSVVVDQYESYFENIFKGSKKQ